jgi:hypothetical protein
MFYISCAFLRGVRVVFCVASARDGCFMDTIGKFMLNYPKKSYQITNDEFEMI